MHESKSFGVLLQDFRARLGMAQNALARASGINVGTVNRIERDQRLPAGRDQALALARALGLDMAQTNQLLHAAGLPAEGFGPAITSDPRMCRLALVLQDPFLPSAVREELIAVIDHAVLLATHDRGHAAGA